MGLDDITRSRLYRTWVRPVLWWPIFEYRRVREARMQRFFEQLAKEDTQLLLHVRAQLEREQPDEQKPLVSITTPTYNRAGILMDTTVPAVLAQTYANFEWLIVGDHCTDDTGELLAGVRDPRVRFHNLPERPRYPRNKRQRWKIVGYKANTLAHQLAKGTWIAHLDDDDVYTPDHIEKLLVHALKGNYEFVSGRSRVERLPGEWVERGERHNSGIQGQGFISHSTVLYRAYLDKVFAYDPGCLRLDMAGDSYRWRRMVNAGVRMGFLDEVVTLIPLRPGEAARSILQPD